MTTIAHQLSHVQNSNSACVLRHAHQMMNASTQVEIRAIRSDDEQRMVTFHQGLSERSVYMRYFTSLSFVTRTAHNRLARTCFADPTREIVLVAISADRRSNQEKIVAVGRLSKLNDPNKAEVALLVLDEFHGRGIGTKLLHQLIAEARDQRITEISAEVLRDNTAMQKILKHFGFHLRLMDPRSVRGFLNL